METIDFTKELKGSFRGMSNIKEAILERGIPLGMVIMAVFLIACEEEIGGTEPDLAFYALANSRFNVYTMNIDGSNQKLLTGDTGHDLSPQFAPDGSGIFFWS
jgi:hypothetical protein